MKVKKFILTFGRTYMKIHTPTMVQEGGGGGPDRPPRVFDMLQYFETILPSAKKWPKMACDVTNNGRHLEFYQELEIR